MASDLVTDSKLVVRFSAQHIHHVVFVSDARPGQQVRRRRKEETWEKVEHLGQGGGGTVWLERCLSVDSQPKTRAVKAIPKQTPFSQPIDYKRELEAIAKFSQTKVCGMHTAINHLFPRHLADYIASTRASSLDRLGGTRTPILHISQWDTLN